MTSLTTVIVAFVVMEPFTYVAHRWIMHGFGQVWHMSHHRPATTTFEANDLFPVVFAGITILAMAAGVSLPSVPFLLTVGIGVTAYGAAYLFVHDVYIHGRLGHLPGMAPLERLKQAHRIHHLYGGEPYGMLVPIVPAELRQRAARTPRDPLAELSAR
jgi:beta-carotene 3-hydroxylase